MAVLIYLTSSYCSIACNRQETGIYLDFPCISCMQQYIRREQKENKTFLELFFPPIEFFLEWFVILCLKLLTNLVDETIYGLN